MKLIGDINKQVLFLAFYNKEKTMKKIFGLTVAALMVMGLIGGGTWAYFSDPETVTGNILTAGTLDLQLTDDDETDADGVTATWGGALMRPDDTTVGDDTAGNVTEGTATLTIGNAGSIDGYLDLSGFTVVDDENAAVVSEAETDTASDGDLGPLLDVWMFWDANGDGDFDNATDVDIYGTTGGTDNDGFAEATPVKLDTLHGGSSDDGIAISAASDTYITLYWRWPSSGSDNDAQGDKVTLTFQVDLEQNAAD